MRLANICHLGVKELRSLVRDPIMLVLIVYAFTVSVYTAATAMPETLNKAPIAVVVLLNPYRQWVCGRDGEKGGEVDPAETFDARAVMGVEKAVVCEPADRETFAAGSSDTQRSGIRSIIAQPMHHDGEVVGQIYIADARPREWLPSEVAYMERSARLMVAQVEARAMIAERDRRIELEQELAEAGELYRTVVSNMTEGVVLVSTEGVIVASNAVAREVLGVTEEAIHGRTPVDPQWNPIREDETPLPPEENPVLIRHCTLEGINEEAESRCGNPALKKWIASHTLAMT